jgi:hypothetical protein
MNRLRLIGIVIALCLLGDASLAFANSVVAQFLFLVGRLTMRPRFIAVCSTLFVLSSAAASTAQAQDLCLDAAVNYAAGNGPNSVFAADLDGDNDADLAVANPLSDNVSVLKNNGDGTFAAAVNYMAESPADFAHRSGRG